MKLSSLSRRVYLLTLSISSSFFLINSSFAQNPINLPSLSFEGFSEHEISTIDCRQQRAVAEKGLSLFQAVCIAVQRYPSIASAMSGYASQVDMVDAAKSGYYPQVSFGVQTTKATGDTSGYANTPKLSVQQRVYDFGKVSSSVDESQGEVERQRGGLLQKVDDVVVQTSLAVIEVQRLESLEGKAKDMVAGIKKVVDIAQSRANAGISTQSVKYC